MTSNSFDALLDFGDSSPADNGTIQQSSTTDVFDPFGSGPTIDVKGNAGGSNLLGDFSFDNQTSNSSGFSFNTSDNINPLYELSTSDISSSSSPPVKMAATEPTNPLYELSQDEQPQKQISSSSGTNPLYDLMSNDEQNGHVTVTSDDSGVTMGTNGDDLLVSIETKRDSASFEQTNGIHDSIENGYVEEEVSRQEEEGELLINSTQEQEVPDAQEVDRDFTQEVGRDFTQEVDISSQEVVDYTQEVDNSTQEVDNSTQETNDFEQEVTDDVAQEVTDDVEKEMIGNVVQEVTDDVKDEQIRERSESPRISTTEEFLIEESEVQTNLVEVQDEDKLVETEQSYEQEEYSEQVNVEPDSGLAVESLIETEQEVQQPEQNLLDVEPEVEQEAENEQEDVKTGKLVTETTEQKSAVEDSSVQKTAATVQENGLDEEPPKDPNVFRETRERDEVHFEGMSSMKAMYESGKSPSEKTVNRPSPRDEIAAYEGGEYENEPIKDPNVFRESDRNIGEELPEIGMAKSRLEKYKQIESAAATPTTSKKRELISADSTGPVEYVSEPRTHVEKYESKIEGGVFENEPENPEGVVRSFETIEDVKPEQGYARNILSKFKQIESEVKNQPAPSPGKRELTPDRTGKVEYVSEPRTVLEKYEGRTEAGVFESNPEPTDVVRSGETSEEIMYERGTAKNIASRFKQIEEESKSQRSPPSGGKRELTPDRTGKVEYVSEPRGVVEKYEGVSESGVFESKPQDQEEVVKSGQYVEEPLPEAGFTRNVAAKFKELEKSGGSSPVTPTRRKEFTPPREEQGRIVAGVLESTPQERPDVVKSSDVNVHVYEEELPEVGMTRNVADKFRKIQSSSHEETTPRSKKEFTPPPQAGVYENTPAPSLVVETRTAESGILENQPDRRPDIAREHSVEEQELPEQGFAKNMVSKWRQMESESGKQTPSPGKYKEFTPPRDEPRIKSPLSPKSPAGTDSSVHPSELPGQYQEQVSPGIYENKPEHREDLVREADTDWAEGLPNKDTTKHLLDKFKHIQEDAKAKEETPKPISRKDSTDSSHSPAPTPKKAFEDTEGVDSPKSPFVAVQLEKCAACGKTVYAMEKVEMNNQSYHKACFKCSHCKARLTAKTFSVNQGIIYCTNHFKQLFARKGNYDEGFGRQQYKAKWQDQKSIENGDGPAA